MDTLHKLGFLCQKRRKIWKSSYHLLKCYLGQTKTFYTCLSALQTLDHGIYILEKAENIYRCRADAITHIKYWFRVSSILERTKNSTKTNNTSFERSDSGFLKSWRLGAWHSYWPATLTLYEKLSFLGEEGVASPWCCHAPVLHKTNV